MKTFKSHTDLSKLKQNASVFIPEDTIFADIETTGLSPQKHFIYCIGISYIEKDSLVILQWFAEHRLEEPEILHEFLQFLQNEIRTIVTYNGKTFDLPFIEKRCKTHHLQFDLSGILHRDLLQEIRPLKALLSLPHLRQKDLEEFLDISREDLYDGGKLIQIYLEYEKSHDPELLHLLWLHNYEDMKGMYRILPVLSYKELLDGHFHLSGMTCESYTDYRENERFSVSIQITYDHELPRSVTHMTDHLQILLKERCGIISFPVLYGELKYFLEDYKNYYYLIEEDTVIHKSVGQYVEKQYRVPAKKNNCCLRKTGYFLPGTKSDRLCCFRKDYQSRQFYIDLSDLWNTDHILPPSKLSEELQQELCDLLLYWLNHFHKTQNEAV